MHFSYMCLKYVHTVSSIIIFFLGERVKIVDMHTLHTYIENCFSSTLPLKI